MRKGVKGLDNCNCIQSFNDNIQNITPFLI